MQSNRDCIVYPVGLVPNSPKVVNSPQTNPSAGICKPELFNTQGHDVLLDNSSKQNLTDKNLTEKEICKPEPTNIQSHGDSVNIIESSRNQTLTEIFLTDNALGEDLKVAPLILTEKQHGGQNSTNFKDPKSSSHEKKILKDSLANLDKSKRTLSIQDSIKFPQFSTPIARSSLMSRPDTSRFRTLSPIGRQTRIDHSFDGSRMEQSFDGSMMAEQSFGDSTMMSENFGLSILNSLSFISGKFSLLYSVTLVHWESKLQTRFSDFKSLSNYCMVCYLDGQLIHVT